ncbi:hypothetical protein Gotri_028262 [Gossypium trilobum]|uniref:Nucleotide-diphospho-sugar transferase domain-containing protein n=1 Tax=Gossypium trilobum TaxID=34281 RepID=A0A7J9FMY9_9ROSI|nr:hypothetical protein [Gossypium trilobum]
MLISRLNVTIFFGDPDDLNNMPNGGFNYVKSNNRSIAFYKF